MSACHAKAWDQICSKKEYQDSILHIQISLGINQISAFTNNFDFLGQK